MAWILCWQPCVHSDGEEERRQGVSYAIMSRRPSSSSSRTPSSLHEAFQLAAQLRSRVAAGRRNERRTARPHPNLSYQKKLSTDNDDDDNDDGDPDADGEGDVLNCPSVKALPESTDEDGLRDLSFEALTEAIDSVDDISHRTLAAIRELELKDNIAGKPDLSSLVNDYFKNCADLLRFFIALCNRLRTARESKTVILDAFDSSVMEELLSERKKLYDELVAKKKKLDKQLRSARKRRKVRVVVHILLCAVGIALSALLGLLGGPAGAITAATVATTACLSIGPWLESRWKKYKSGLEEQIDAVATMRGKALSSEHMLRRVQRLVKRVDVAAKSLLGATRDPKGKTAAAAAADEEEMEKKLGELMKSIEQCSVELCRDIAGVTEMVAKK